MLPGAPNPLPAEMKARVEYVDDMRPVDGVRRVIASLGGRALREAPLSFSMCGSYEDPQSLSNPVLDVFVDMNGNDTRDAGDYAHTESLENDSLVLTQLTFTLTRI